MKSIYSYNVNGIRAAVKKGFFDWMSEANPDVICLQEVKIHDDQLEESWRNPEGYHGFWEFAEKRGYSGVAIFCKEEPLNVVQGCGIQKYDREGRVIRVDFKDFSVINLYLPSGTTGGIRQEFKEEFMTDFHAYISHLRKAVPNLVISGDYNICHKPIDIHDPVRNKNSSGFLPHEREWVSQFLDSGFVDSFRLHNPDPHHYSWWSYRANARSNNKGWRIDYHMLTESLRESCTGASILPNVVHSDHCPIMVEIDL